jgi:hypothetical protein
LGVWCGLRLRPVIPGASDRTPRYPQAYRTLIDWAAEAGARSISYELLYVPMRFHGEQMERWKSMERTVGVPIKEAYKRMGKSQASLRPSAMWSENIVHAIYERAKGHGMVVGVSEPAWKGLNDGGCCCGMINTHPVFGNFEPRNATQAIVDARDTGKKIRVDDVAPEWSSEVKFFSDICPAGAGPKEVWKKRHVMYRDWIEKDFFGNGVRSPEVYFQGMLRRNGGGYEYVDRGRRRLEGVPFWSV